MKSKSTAPKSNKAIPINITKEFKTFKYISNVS